MEDFDDLITSGNVTGGYSSGIVDGDGLLLGSYRTTYLGIAGWELGDDETAPTVLDNPTIGSNGTTVTINFSEPVVTTGYDNGDFDLDCTTAGNNISLKNMTGSGSSRTVETDAVTIYPGDTCDLDYTGGADEIEDASGNDLAQFSDDTVTNNSAASASESESTLSGVSIN
jgi:hypothetical protein